MIWAVDVWLLYKSSESGVDPLTLASQAFLTSLESDGGIALSPEVFSAYSSAVDKLGTKFGAKWFAAMSKLVGRVQRIDEPEDRGCAELREALADYHPPFSLHDDDVCYAVLAHRSPDRHLISGDVGNGDFAPDCTSWLHVHWSICFHDLATEDPYHSARHACLTG